MGATWRRFELVRGPKVNGLVKHASLAEIMLDQPAGAPWQKGFKLWVLAFSKPHLGCPRYALIG